MKKNYIMDFVKIIIGSALMGFGTALFLLPNQLSTGGFAGIATITYYLFEFQMGTTILLLNIPIFLLAIYKLGKDTFMKSLFGSITYSAFIDIFSKIQPLTHDRFLACIYGGVLLGLGSAMILKAHATTGGTELVTVILKEYKKNYKVSDLIVVMDIVIVTLNIIVFGKIEIGLYSAIAIYIMGKIIDVFFEGIYFTKLIFIISKDTEVIANEIGYEIKRGTTGLYGKMMYTKEDTTVLICAASRRDVIKVKEIAKEIDENSFIIIANAREVFGKGFK